ncbi:hypothetical protein [Massilia sp. NR 4-1]|uniref:hypothetical protein n=1 Tax=Massilia sp. NR 4-1 TaxID=1678028 RepID=UPI00123754F1|nr:hypothetical protein [Massilia sp. NR 4-1]
MQLKLINDFSTKKLKTGEENPDSGAAVASSAPVAASSSGAASAATEKTGLAHPDAIKEFVAQMREVESQWNTKSPEEKIAHFQELINPKFDAIGVRAPTVKLMDPTGGRSGEFNSTEWSFGMTETALGKPMAESAKTAYHETRHAEQYFMMAKHIAQTGIAPPPYKQIPDDVMTVAQTAPKLSGAEAKEAGEYHKSIFGADAKKRNFVLTNLGTYSQAALVEKGQAFTAAHKAYEAADETVKKYKEENHKLVGPENWPDETQKKNGEARKNARQEREYALSAYNDTKQKFEETQAKYRALPEEEDAHAVGDAIMAALSSPSELHKA